MKQPYGRELIPAYRGDEPFVFVSWDHDDARIVLAEIAALNESGFRTYYDEGIHPGSVWHDELATALNKCSALIFFVTPRSVASSMCQREVKFALDRQKPVLAVHLEQTTLPDGLALAIGDRQAILRTRLSEADYRKRVDDAVASFVPRVSPAEEILRQPTDPKTRRRALQWTVAVFAIAALVVGACVIVRDAQDGAAAQAQRTAVLSEVESLIKQDNYGAAFTRLRPLALRAETAADTDVEALWKQIVSPMKPIVADSGATVRFKPYKGPDSEWVAAGTSPITQWVDAPKGVLRIQVEKPGYVTGEFAVANPSPSVETMDSEALGVMGALQIGIMPLELSAVGTLADGFVRVPATDLPVNVGGWTFAMADYQRPLPAFAIGRTEITNAQYKAFVDARGYDNPVYWADLPFADQGKSIAWADVRGRFVDQTGRAGPAAWQVGSYPAGQADYPVGGISWYEAAAYARFRGLALPTIHHWARTAFGPFDAFFGVMSSVAATSRFLADSPVAEDPGLGLGPWGTVHTAGNVREWVWNSTGDLGIAMGGSWSDPPEFGPTLFPTSRFDRSAQNGLRLMQNLDAARIEPDPLAPIDLEIAVAPTSVSNEAFQAMRFQFTAEPRVPREVDSKPVAESDLWTAHEVTLHFGGDDRFVLYLVQPRSNKTRMQPVIFAPGVGSWAHQPNQNALSEIRNVDFIVAAGRALVIPIWRGTYERFEPIPEDAEAAAVVQRRAPLDWFRDLSTTLDYLSTRDDIDSERTAIMGFSHGARFIVEPLLAIEGRLRAAVLLSGGLVLAPLDPMLEAMNYAPRTHLPVLMINGRYDNSVPIVKAQRAYFDQLGTPIEDKRHIPYDCGHIDYPRNRLAADVTDWLDRYLGPVRTAGVSLVP